MTAGAGAARRLRGPRAPWELLPAGARRPLLPAVIGPVAAHIIARDYGEELLEKAGDFERWGQKAVGQQLRDAVVAMGESARLRNERQRESEDYGTTEVPETAGESSCVGPILGASEVAGMLRMTPRRVTGLVNEKQLPATRGPGRGRPWRFAVADVEDYLAGRREKEGL